MNQTRTSRKILAFASITEAATGLALMIEPAIVVKLLLGAELSGVGAVLGRCFGIALMTLGLACWPGAGVESPPAYRAMAIYNTLIALYLAFLGAVEHMAGLLLWPAVALHAAVALLLVRPRRGGGGTEAVN